MLYYSSWLVDACVLVKKKSFRTGAVYSFGQQKYHIILKFVFRVTARLFTHKALG